MAVAPLAGGTRYVANIWLNSPPRIGLPLHVVEGDSIITSFGAGPASEPLSAFSARRVLATDPARRIVSARYYDYESEVWDASGRRITGYSGPRLNDPSPMQGAISVANPYPNTIMAIHPEGDVRLWVVVWRRKADWLDLMEETQRPNGDVALTRRSGVTLADLFVTRIDVVDLPSATIVARQERAGLIGRFLNDSLVWGPKYDPSGAPLIEVLRLRLQVP